jgi:hypothetical protein
VGTEGRRGSRYAARGKQEERSRGDGGRVCGCLKRREGEGGKNKGGSEGGKKEFHVANTTPQPAPKFLHSIGVCKELKPKPIKG